MLAWKADGHCSLPSILLFNLQELTAPSGSPPTAALNLSLQPPQSPAGAGAGAELVVAAALPQGGGREVEQQQEQQEPRQLGIGPQDFDELL